MPNTITVATAKDWLQRWRDNQDRYNSSHHVKGFTIPIQDLIDIQDTHNVSEARAYLGVTPTWEEKIVMCAVDGNGNDMIDASLGQYVYDHITPCPPDCGSGGLNDWT